MTNLRNILFLIVFYLLSWGKGKSQEIMNLQECMIFAREHALKNIREDAQLRIYKADKTESIGSFLPAIGASVSGQYSYGRSSNPETNIYQDNTYFNNGYSASLQLPLFDGLIRFNQLRMTKSLLKMGYQQKKVVEDAISLQVMRSFYNVIYCSQLADQLRGQLAESERNLYQAHHMEELGLKAGADIAQMEANVAADQFALLKQENLLEKAHLQLKVDMNYPLSESLLIDLNLPLIDPEISLEDPDSLFSRASTYLPAVRKAVSQLKSEEYGFKKSMGAFFPKFSFFAGYNTNYFEVLNQNNATASFKDQFQNNAGQYIGVQMSIPIFGQLSRISERRRAKQRMRISETQYAEEMIRIRSEIKQSILDFNGACKEYLQAIRKLNAAEIAYRVNKRKFEEGMISALELQNSANQLTLAKAESIGMHVQYLICDQQLDYYHGIPFIKTSKDNQ